MSVGERAAGLGGVAAYPCADWPATHQACSAVFFFNALVFMQVAAKVDAMLAPSFPPLASGARYRFA